MAHLTRKTGGCYHVRVRVPLDLVPMVGRQEIRRSLATSDPRAARLNSGRVAAAIMDALETMRMTGDKERLEQEVAEAARSYTEGMEAVVWAQSAMLDAAQMLNAIKEGQTRIRGERLIGAVTALAQGVGTASPAPDPFAGLHANARLPWHSLIAP